VKLLGHLAGAGFKLGNAKDLWLMVKTMRSDIPFVALNFGRLGDLRNIRRRKCCSIHRILYLRCHTLTIEVSGELMPEYSEETYLKLVAKLGASTKEGIA